MQKVQFIQNYSPIHNDVTFYKPYTKFLSIYDNRHIVYTA